MITRRLLPEFIVKNTAKSLYQGEIQAYTIFLDMSGFTRLTESLMQQGHFGAERLSVILNKIFGDIVHLIDKGNGFIPYFAGDALSGVFLESEVSELEFLHTLQSIFQLFEHGMKFDESTITVKIGLSKGTVEWGIVGNKQLAFYLKGPAIDNSSNNQLRAVAGEIAADLSFYNLFKRYGIACYEERDLLKVDRFDVELPVATTATTTVQTSSLAILQRFYPNSLIEITNNGEFKSVVSVFISFEDIHSHADINEFVTVILDEVISFSGYFKEIDFGDKGGVITVFFGIPITFENNIERALTFVGALTEVFASTNFKYRIAVTQGIAFAGIIGGKERSQYAAVGNRVNLAARLMSYAAWGEVLVDERVSKDKKFQFDYKGKIKYKGIAGEVPTYQLLGTKNHKPTAFGGKMVARNKELAALINFARPLAEGKFAGIAAIAGEAGIGKSRLAYELNQYLILNQDIEIIHCQCDQILRKAFNPFVYFIKNYFKQLSEASGSQNLDNFNIQFDILVEKLYVHHEKELMAELNRLKSIFLAILGVFTADSLWEMLDAKGRYENTKIAIHTLIKSLARTRPVMILVEDAHWCDESSLQVVHEFIPYCANYPLFMLITSRYLDNGNRLTVISDTVLDQHKIPTLDLNLNIFDKESIKNLAIDKLQGNISDEIVEVLEKSSNGNPFYVEQILDYLVENKSIAKEGEVWTIKQGEVKLSTSINSILVARVDRLSVLVKSTVKAAAVIGREFEVPILSEVMRNQAEFQTGGNYQSLLNEQIAQAEENQIWRAMSEMKYLFKHSLLREAVYDMQLRSRLKEIHLSIGEAIEKLFPERLEERYEDLAFHFEKAEDKSRTILYLKKAANKSRQKYQNQQAIDFYDKLLHYLDDPENIVNKVSILLKKANIQELIGHWDSSMQTCNSALLLAENHQLKVQKGRINNTLGNLYLLKGDYTSAKIVLENAINIFHSENDSKGLAIANGNLGNLYFRQGQYEEAKRYFIGAIEINQLKNYPTSAQLVANLGLTYMNQNLFDLGIACLNEQLELAQMSSDSRSLAILNTNIGIVYFEKGDYEKALLHYQQGLDLSKMLGNQLLVSIALGCIGSVYERKGDFQKAMNLYYEDLEICQQLGDKQGISIALGLIGGLYSLQGQFDKAVSYMNQNLHLCEQLHYRKGIAKALNILGDINFFLEKFDRALEYYDRAIVSAREIDNKILIIASLVEKGEVLLAKAETDLVKIVIAEAEAYNLSTDHLLLHFDIELLKCKLAVVEKKHAEAIQLLANLLPRAKTTVEQAAISYIYYKLDPSDELNRTRSIQLYQNLFAQTPKHLYGLRLKKLQN